MNKQFKTEQEVLILENKYLLFWLWEYGRRHSPKNQKIFKSLIKRETSEHAFGPTSEGNILYRFEPPIQPMWVRADARCAFYLSSDEVVTDIASGAFTYRMETSYATIGSYVIPAVVLFSFSQHSSWLKELPAKYGLDHEQYNRLMKESFEILEKASDATMMTIPNFMDEKEIFANLTAMRNAPPEERIATDQGDKELYEISRLQSEKMVLMRRTSLRKVPPESSNAPRAVGLWLWDYVHQNSVSQAEAIREFVATYRDKFEDLGLEKVEDSGLRHFYRRTADCIQQGKIVSFSKKVS